jgi:hypothetical protein
MSAVTTNLLAELQLKKRKKRLVVVQQWRMIASDTGRCKRNHMTQNAGGHATVPSDNCNAAPSQVEKVSLISAGRP